MIDKRPSSTGANTIIGETIAIRGNIEGQEDLTIKGRIEGSITLTRDLFVEPSGIVKADVNVQNIFISGILIGNIVASERVEIASDGRMIGDINAPRVLIHDGAAFRGRVEMPDMEGARTGPPPSRPGLRGPSRPAVRPAPRPAPARMAPPSSPAARPAEGASEGGSSEPPRPPLPPSEGETVVIKKPEGEEKG